MTLSGLYRHMAEEELDLFEFATGNVTQPSAGTSVMPHAALSSLCRMPDYAEAISKISSFARSLGVCGPERFGMIGEGYRLFRKASSSSSGR